MSSAFFIKIFCMKHWKRNDCRSTTHKLTQLSRRRVHDDEPERITLAAPYCTTILFRLFIGRKTRNTPTYRAPGFVKLTCRKSLILCVLTSLRKRFTNYSTSSRHENQDWGAQQRAKKRSGHVRTHRHQLCFHVCMSWITHTLLCKPKGTQLCWGVVSSPDPTYLASRAGRRVWWLLSCFRTRVFCRNSCRVNSIADVIWRHAIIQLPIACIANGWLCLIQSVEKHWGCCCYGGRWKTAGLQIWPNRHEQR